MAEVLESPMGAQRQMENEGVGTDVARPEYDDALANRQQQPVHLRRITLQRQRHFSKMSTASSTTKSTIRGTHPAN